MRTLLTPLERLALLGTFGILLGQVAAQLVYLIIP